MKQTNATAQMTFFFVLSPEPRLVEWMIPPTFRVGLPTSPQSGKLLKDIPRSLSQTRWKAMTNTQDDTMTTHAHWLMYLYSHTQTCTHTCGKVVDMVI